MTQQFAVIGNPIDHSLSPLIHQQFAQQFSDDINYQKKRVEIGGFDAAVNGFFGAGGIGLNVTVPFKLEAFNIADNLSQRASAAGAVNTLWCRDGKIYGDNTDGAGLVADLLDNLRWSLSGSRILILGAGGAVRGVLNPLLDCRPDSIVIANRTESKAAALVDVFGGSVPIASASFESVQGAFDIIINGTSGSIDGVVPQIAAECYKNARCYDMFYGKEPTSFLVEAQSSGAVSCADGLGMLVGQAAESYFIWTGHKADTVPVLKFLRSHLYSR